MWAPAEGGPRGMEAAGNADHRRTGRAGRGGGLGGTLAAVASGAAHPVRLLLEASTGRLTLSCFDYEVSARIQVTRR
jgi:hypothetical protein